MKVVLPVKQRYNKAGVIIGLLGTVLSGIILWISQNIILGVIGFVLLACSWIISVTFVSNSEITRPVPLGDKTAVTQQGFYQGDNAAQEAIDDLGDDSGKVRLL